jgi:hypothetical protein
MNCTECQGSVLKIVMNDGRVCFENCSLCSNKVQKKIHLKTHSYSSVDSFLMNESKLQNELDYPDWKAHPNDKI